VQPRRVRWWAPGRVTLIGDHTDYTGGLVLPFAIPQGSTVDVEVDATGTVTVRSTRFPGKVHRRPLSGLPEADSGWAAYVDGAVHLLRSSGVPIEGVTVTITSDLPVGAGLSSSAALTCATLAALSEATDQRLAPDEIATLAQRVENEYIRAPVGFMDPAVVMLASAGHALLVDCSARTVSSVPFDLAADDLVTLVVDTGERHATSGSTYAERVEQCRAVVTRLGISSLREVKDVTTVELIDDPVLRARARHVVTENERVRAVVALLRAGRAREIGPMLIASHESLRDDFGVSTRALDLVVDGALDAGALGARLTGAGMGGCAVLLSNRTTASGVTAEVQKALYDKGYRDSVVRAVQPSGAARRVPDDVS
jgi:galactokinase